MSSPPQTPHRRHRSSVGSGHIHMSRRSSGVGGMSPQTSRSSAHFSDHRNSLSMSNELGGPLSPSVTNAGNGLGNLADELAEAWDSEGEGEGDGEVDGDDSAMLNGADDGHLSPDSVQRKGHSRSRSRYDGSDYGEDDDFGDSEGISKGLEKQMAAVESLARRGMEVNGSDADAVVERATLLLRELGSQSGIETGATRLSTAHSALSTHLTHQTRSITSLTSTLLSPLSVGPDPAIIDDLLSLIASTLESLPQATSAPLYALHGLTNSTRELVSTLDVLSDNLHMSRQTYNTASRRLRGVKDVMAEWRKENEASDEGVRWIEKGAWDTRLEGRECAGVCRDVISGVEEVCNGWSARLEGAREAEVGAAG